MSEHEEELYLVTAVFTRSVKVKVVVVVEAGAPRARASSLLLELRLELRCRTYDLGERGCEPYTVRSEPAAPVMRFARWLR